MFTAEETQEMTVLNALMSEGSIVFSDIYKYMFEHYEPPEELDIREAIRKLCNSLKKQFNKLGIRLFEQTVMGHRYTITEEARQFCMENLYEVLFDEYGEAVGAFFQHPLSLSEERKELI